MAYVLTILISLSLYTGNTLAYDNTPEIKEIIISCDLWQGTCNKDGSGIYFDIIRAVYETEGIKVHYRIDPFIRSIKLIDENKVDIMAAAYRLPEREKRYTYPNIRFMTEFVSVLRLASTPQQAQAKISGRVNIIRGYNYKKYLDENAKLEEVSRSEQGVRMLLSQRSDFFINPYYASYKALQELAAEDSNIKLTEFKLEVIEDIPVYLLFPKTARGETLAKLYDKNFTELYNKGIIKTIFDRYPINTYFYYFPEVSNTELKPPLYTPP